MSLFKTFIAIAIALAGSTFLWLVSPYNDLFVGASYLTECYLPTGPLLILLLIVMVINPLLRRCRPHLMLGYRQMLLVMGILFVASTISGTGLLRQLPYALARMCQVTNSDHQLAEAVTQGGLRAELFPDKLEFGHEATTSEAFLDELPADAPIPWQAWLAPAMTWGALMLCAWCMVIGLSQLVIPQWRDNERLAFPLLTIMRPLMREPEEGNYLGSIFRQRLFWIGLGIVLCIHITNGYHTRYPDALPAIPLAWNISSLFTEGILRNAPWDLMQGRIYIIFLGAAFFMPTRISFSVWFFALASFAYSMIMSQYSPPFYGSAITDQRMGAMFMMALIVVYLGRRYFYWALSRLWHVCKEDAEKVARKSVLLFLLGCLGMCLWFCWNHVSWPWAMALTLFVVVISLIMARIVAETGLPFVSMQFYDIAILKILPFAWFSIPVLFFIRAVAAFFAVASRMALAVMTTHALAADTQQAPRHRWRYGLLMLGVLLAGYVVCGTTHLRMNYAHSTPLYQSAQSPINVWGTRRLLMANSEIKTFAASGQFSRPPHNRPANLLTGAGLTLALEAACLYIPRWPLHPIGLLMANSYYSNVAWPSIFLGWLFAVLILRYGGARAYRTAGYFFIGIIVGDILAAGYWAIESSIMAALGIDYIQIWVQPR